MSHRPQDDLPNRQEPTSRPPAGFPTKAQANLIQFHPLQREIYVMDTSATRILYSLDGKTWKEAESFRIEGGAWQWAAAAVRERGHAGVGRRCQAEVIREIHGQQGGGE